MVVAVGSGLDIGSGLVIDSAGVKVKVMNV